mmetsp:Transcript_5020/g.12985  ORF Transcript_5020/g.12985 Transcript_5020/m.12985 type:complete len:214 (-) Transcript_5020:1029-1670(-)
MKISGGSSETTPSLLARLGGTSIRTSYRTCRPKRLSRGAPTSAQRLPGRWNCGSVLARWRRLRRSTVRRRSWTCSSTRLLARRPPWTLGFTCSPSTLSGTAGCTTTSWRHSTGSRSEMRASGASLPGWRHTQPRLPSSKGCSVPVCPPSVWPRERCSARCQSRWLRSPPRFRPLDRIRQYRRGLLSFPMASFGDGAPPPRQRSLLRLAGCRST